MGIISGYVVPKVTGIDGLVPAIAIAVIIGGTISLTILAVGFTKRRGNQDIALLELEELHAEGVRLLRE